MAAPRRIRLGLVVGVLASAALAGARPTLVKKVTEKATFALYLPQGWRAGESATGQYRSLMVSDPQGRHFVALSLGLSPAGSDVVAVTRSLVSSIARQCPGLRLTRSLVARDRRRLMFDATYGTGAGAREFRAWVSMQGTEFTYASIAAPQGQLAAQRRLLLTVLSNVQVLKGSFQYQGATPAQVRWQAYRLRDGSASFQIPAGWRVQDFGKGFFVATDPTGRYAFMVAAVEVMSPRYGRYVRGALVSPYLAPSRGMAFVCAKQGHARNMRFERVIPRQDMARAVSGVYTVGPGTVEEFVYTFTSRQGGAGRGYTFGLSFGTRMDTGWSLWHLSVWAPAAEFGAYAGVFAQMLGSYKVDDEWARKYVAAGMARVRAMQAETARIVAQNARDIRQMMDAAYRERQLSWDYIDYKRTRYIRGEQDWISAGEGGTIYRSDHWGLKNTATGEYVAEGEPCNYYNFRGGGGYPGLVPIDSREVWQRHVHGGG